MCLVDSNTNSSKHACFRSYGWKWGHTIIHQFSRYAILPVTKEVLDWFTYGTYFFSIGVKHIAAWAVSYCKLFCVTGGSPYATVAILDIMAAIKCDVSTVAFGMCASTATLLLVSMLMNSIKLTWSHTSTLLTELTLLVLTCLMAQLLLLHVGGLVCPHEVVVGILCS